MSSTPTWNLVPQYTQAYLDAFQRHQYYALRCVICRVEEYIMVESQEDAIASLQESKWQLRRLGAWCPDCVQFSYR